MGYGFRGFYFWCKGVLNGLTDFVKLISQSDFEQGLTSGWQRRQWQSLQGSWVHQFTRYKLVLLDLGLVYWWRDVFLVLFPEV